MTVGELLQASRDAHLRYRESVPHRIANGPASTTIVPGDVAAAGQFLAQACRLRVEAQAVDPARVDPAWQDEPITHEHDALLTFYAGQLSA